LAEVLVEKMSPISIRLRQLIDDPAEIDRVLAKGAERASTVADPVVKDVKKIIGLWG
jgi:tryptophanyl-tRNA synthetase